MKCFAAYAMLANTFFRRACAVNIRPKTAIKLPDNR